MKALALVFALGGCSWLGARSANIPHTGCSYAASRIDTVMAIAGVSTLFGALTFSALDTPNEISNIDEAIASTVAAAGLLTAIFYGPSALHGHEVAGRCVVDRSRLASTGEPPR